MVTIFIRVISPILESIMVKDKKGVVPPRRTISQSTPGSFDDSLIYQLITTSPAEQVASDLREAIFFNYEDVHVRCPESG